MGHLEIAVLEIKLEISAVIFKKLTVHFYLGYLFKYLNLWFFLKNYAVIMLENWEYQCCHLSLNKSITGLQVTTSGSPLPLEYHPDEGLKMSLEQALSLEEKR